MKDKKNDETQKKQKRLRAVLDAFLTSDFDIIPDTMSGVGDALKKSYKKIIKELSALKQRSFRK